MRKDFTTTITAILLALSLTACGEEVPAMTALDYELDLESNTTCKGITIGDSKEAFLAAYGEYDIQTCVEEGPYQALSTDEIPFEKSIQTILPTFFIDGKPVTIGQICKENDIERTELLSFLSSEEYLSSHSVTYYYLVFTWENGVITDIRSEYMDYNTDASYYEELDSSSTESNTPPQAAGIKLEAPQGVFDTRGHKLPCELALIQVGINYPANWL